MAAPAFLGHWKFRVGCWASNRFSHQVGLRATKNHPFKGNLRATGVKKEKWISQATYLKELTRPTFGASERAGLEPATTLAMTMTYNKVLTKRLQIPPFLCPKMGIQETFKLWLNSCQSSARKIGQNWFDCFKLLHMIMAQKDTPSSPNGVGYRRFRPTQGVLA